MKIISLQWKFVIGLIIVLISIISLTLWILSSFDKGHSRLYSQNIEDTVIDTFSRLYEFQQDFKNAKIIDNNNNGVGEYATTYELVEYIRKKKDRMFRFDAVYREDFIMRSSTRYRIFLSSEIILREKKWVCLAIPEPRSKIGYRWTYYLDEGGIIFFTPEDLSEKISDDQWLLNKVFLGEPFKSPLNTLRWKIWGHSIEEYRKTHPWPKDDKPKEPNKPNEPANK
ncbi:MAG: hypothetical protein V1701_08075 [Planctomycetota bacterium]